MRTITRRCSFRVTATVGALLSACVVTSSVALADTTPIPRTPPLGWAAATHQSPIEVLAGKIASHIAGRSVRVLCEGPTEWAAITGTGSGEAGFVSTTWDSTTGELLTTADVAKLDGDSICGPLQRFAAAAAKPTKCLSPESKSVFTNVAKHARGQGSASRLRSPASTKLKADRATQAVASCYLPDGREAPSMMPAFWGSYARYAVAILTLAHESIHLGGIVGGRLSNGLAVGDPLAEAKAECYG